MKADDYFNLVINQPMPKTTKALVLVLSEEENYLNAATSFTEEDITKSLYCISKQNKEFDNAIRALFKLIERDDSVPVNTHHSPLAANKAIEDAMKELNAIFVQSSNTKIS